VEQGTQEEDLWKERFRSYAEAFPDLAAQWERRQNGILPDGWEKEVPLFPADPKGMATRVASGKVLNALARQIPNLIGGSADLAPSNKTEIAGEPDFQVDAYGGRNLRFGVREHGMGAILNGMALHGGVIPYGGTFLIFSDYMRPAIRLAALMGLKVIYVFTHDSIGLGEDGPTHQPVEQLAALRAIPGLTVIRPCDANETAQAWKEALRLPGPVALALTRQDVPTLNRTHDAAAGNLARGAYILRDVPAGLPELILIATGSEVSIALQAAEKLDEQGIRVRVVSMPSWELFERGDEGYRLRVLPPEIKARIAIEAGVSLGWQRYVGDSGRVIGLNRFGASAPSGVLFKEFGFTPEHVVETALGLLQKG